MAKAIHFHRDHFEWLSNFHVAPFEIDGRRWTSVEHYFQAQKFAGTDREEAIRVSPSPAAAKRMGQAPGLRSDWAQAKEAVMLHALRAKFSKNAELAAKLLETGERKLIERTDTDNYWGDGRDGRGKNRLGELLMLVRSEIVSRRGQSTTTPQ